MLLLINIIRKEMKRKGINILQIMFESHKLIKKKIHFYFHFYFYVILNVDDDDQH